MGVSDAGILTQTRPYSLLYDRFPVVQDLLDYRRSNASFADIAEEFDCLFKRFMEVGGRGKGLHLKVADDHQADFGSNWATLTINDVERRTKKSGGIMIDLDDEYFDAVLCTGLGRLSMPAACIAEVGRVLKPSGEIWVQVPLTVPYAPAGKESLKEHWRFTPNGLRTLLSSFDEILCSVYVPQRCALRNFSVFYGLKPENDDR